MVSRREAHLPLNNPSKQSCRSGHDECFYKARKRPILHVEAPREKRIWVHRRALMCVLFKFVPALGPFTPRRKEKQTRARLGSGPVEALLSTSVMLEG